MSKKTKRPAPSKAPAAPTLAPTDIPGASRPTISLCMMVKDEEKRLPTALKSARPWVDEIIVVDTGSTDRTVEIAQEFGAKVYHHPWEFNFSKHRNQSLSYATGDWILVLDADEELDQETAPLIKKYAAQARPEVHGFLFELFNALAVGGETFILHPRLFRNRVGFHYQGMVHNRPTLAGAISRAPIKLIHYGYAEDAQTMEAKHQRRLTMIRKWVEREPDNLNSHAYLAHTLACRSETVAEALEEGLTALRLAKQSPENNKFLPHIYYPILQALMALNRDEELLQYAAECRDVSPNHPDPLFFMTVVHFRHQRWEETCQAASKYWDLQELSREQPDLFVFVENLTYDQINQVLFRLVVAASHLGRQDQARIAFERMLDHRDAEQSCKLAVQNLLTIGKYDYAIESAKLAGAKKPQWSWPQLLSRLAGDKLTDARIGELRRDGLTALDEGQYQQATDLLRQATQLSPLDAEALLGLGKALDELGQTQEAEAWLMRGLNAHPGHPNAWKRLGDISFAQGNHAGAMACYQRYLAQQPGQDEVVESRMAALRRRLAGAGPTVAQAPPRLMIFMVAGLSPEMVRQPAPHFLMGTAWGELLPEGLEPGSSLPAWATLLTGVRPEAHGLHQEASRANPHSLADLRVPSIYELLPPDLRIGLLATPLGRPPLNRPGWIVEGYPAGLLEQEMVQPRDLTLQVLAAGYRADFLLSDFEEQTYAQRLTNDVRQEAFLYQVERNKLATAMSLPAVDALAIGFTALDYIQQTHGLAHYFAFAAYQQVYGWIETTIATLKPKHFAVLSQAGYSQADKLATRGGFYCLSWLKGENGQARMTDIAPEMLKLLGGDLAGLGRRR